MKGRGATQFRIPAPPGYPRNGWTADLVAGLTLGVILVPQAMAYGLLAGVEPVYGLYAALVPLLVYGLLASTPHVSVGPTALASLLCLNGLAPLATPGSPEYLGLAIVLALLAGAIQLLLGLFRLGAFASLLSRPVLSGFVSAAAVLIILSQVDALLGMETARTTYLHETLPELITQAGTIHLPSLLLGVGSLGVLVAAGRWLPRRFPAMLLVIVVFTLVIALFGRGWGVATIGAVPSGLPGVLLPEITGTVVMELLPVAAVIALISFIETLSIGETFATRYDYYRPDPNRELIALGASKLVGGLFQAIPTSASFSRSAVVESSGGRGPLTSLVAFLLLGLVLLVLTPLFEYLPLPVLAAIIIFSVRKLFDLAEMRRLWHLAPRELTTLLITFIFTLFTGLQWGIAGGVLLSLIFVFWRAARPHLAELGRVPGTNAFRNRARFAAAEIDPSILIVRFDAELNFGNAAFFRDRIEELVSSRGDNLRAVVLDGHTINTIDTSGLHALELLLDQLERRGVELYLCGVIGPVRDMLYRSGVMQRMGADHNFLSIQDALVYLGGEAGHRGWDRPAVQHD